MAERVRSFTPIHAAPLPRPLSRFGPAFPAALAEAYTAAYTARRAVVLDPLAHPASAADAAERCDRRGVARSPQPLGAWAREVVRRAPSVDAVLAALTAVAESALAGRPHGLAMRELYASRCATCRGPIVVDAFIWERDAPVPTRKAFRCGICAREGRSLLMEPVGPEDEERARSVEERGLAYWQLVERFGAERDLGESVASLYTARNLAALMATLRAIETAVPAGEASDVLRLALLEVIVSGSRLNAVAGQSAPLRIDRGRARRGHASQSREVNVWAEFERTVRELATWIAAHPAAPMVRAPFVELDPGGADLVLTQVPPDDELGGWAHVAGALLGIAPPKPADAHDGTARSRERVLRTARQALLDAHRHSREGAVAAVLVPRADAQAMASVALAGAAAGWQLRSVLYQRDALGSSGASAAVLELDRHPALLRDQAPHEAAAVESEIRAAVRDLIRARGSAVDQAQAAAAALEALAAQGLLPSLALSRATGASEVEVFMDHFRSALADGHRDGVVRVGEGDPRYDLAARADRAPLDDRVEWAVWGLLAPGSEIETPGVLRRVYALFGGPETPDRELVERCLASYAEQGDDGRWRLRAQDALVRRQHDQALLVGKLVDAGHRLGFRVHVGRDIERRALPEPLAARGATLADLLTPEERGARLPEATAFVECAWTGRAGMTFLWHVDWTARLHRPVVELGEAIPDDERTFRFLALPEERKTLAVLKLTREPGLADAVRRRGWRFVKWAPLAAFAADPAARLDDLEPVLGLEPAVERSAHQLSFKW